MFGNKKQNIEPGDLVKVPIAFYSKNALGNLIEMPSAFCTFRCLAVHAGFALIQLAFLNGGIKYTSWPIEELEYAGPG